MLLATLSSIDLFSTVIRYCKLSLRTECFVQPSFAMFNICRKILESQLYLYVCGFTISVCYSGYDIWSTIVEKCPGVVSTGSDCVDVFGLLYFGHWTIVLDECFVYVSCRVLLGLSAV